MQIILSINMYSQLYMHSNEIAAAMYQQGSSHIELAKGPRTLTSKNMLGRSQLFSMQPHVNTALGYNLIELKEKS